MRETSELDIGELAKEGYKSVRRDAMITAVTIETRGSGIFARRGIGKIDGTLFLYC